MTSRPSPRALAGADLGSAAARTQPCFEYGDERLGDLRTAQGAILTIPVRDPVESAGEGKRRHFRVAGLDGPILYALADQPADTVVDLGLEGLDVPAHGRGEVLILRPHHAPAELGGDGLSVMAQHGIQPLARGHHELAHVAERSADLLHTRHEALEQQLLLAGDVVVHGRLGDLGPRGDVIEGGVVVALAVELACRRADDRFTLELALAQPLPVALPGGRARQRGLARRRRAGTAAVHGPKSIIAVRAAGAR